jgi:HKD family nuclease
LGLRNISLKEEYRSDRDDIISEFFIPCLSNCIEYDRCIEFVTIKSLTTLALGFDNFAKNKAKLRMITGHRFNASDLELLSKLFSEQIDIRFSSKIIRDSKVKMLQEIVDNHRLEIKIAIPRSEEVVGSFTEKIGVFLDEHNDAVAFTGTSNETFNTQNRNFESVDVFTAWNDKSRVDTKIKDFEELWEGKTKYVEVYDFKYAEKNNLLKYSSQWALDIV